MSLKRFQSLPSKPADYRIPYGSDTNQFGELRIPAGPGPHPVVVLIHGGCWKAAYANISDLQPMADALKAEGIATWTIEYRRLGQAGSGWPGTYLDAGHAVDHIRSLTLQHPLDVNRVVVVGHSAGGHLSMWIAARSRLPKSSEIYMENPLPIRGVMNIAGTADMEAYIRIEQTACRDRVVEGMLGGTPAEVPHRFAESSAIRMLPLGVPQVIVWGDQDDVVPSWLGEAYVHDARQSGDSVRFVLLPGGGHFDPAAPWVRSWPTVRGAINSLLGATERR